MQVLNLVEWKYKYMIQVDTFVSVSTFFRKDNVYYGHIMKKLMKNDNVIKNRLCRRILCEKLRGI